MQRRKYLIGMGSLAAGGAAAMGTGAFTSVSANRQVKVSVVGDQSAYLKLKDPSAYAQVQGGELTIDFSGEFNGQNGSGVNTAAETAFDDVFKIQNHGTQSVNVWVAREDYLAGGSQSVQIVTDEGNIQSDSGASAVDIAQPPGQTATDIAPAGEGGDGLSENGPEVRPGGYVALGTGDEIGIDVNFFVNDAIGTWNKEWQINAATEAPVADDYDDSTLDGHGGNDGDSDI